MRKIFTFLLSFILLAGIILPAAALAAETPDAMTAEAESWSSEYSRIMDATDRLSAAELKKLDGSSIDFMRSFHFDLAAAAIYEARLQGMTVEEFAAGLYESCDFGYGDSRDGFMCIYIVDTSSLTVVPIGSAIGIFPQQYLDFMSERIPSLSEKYGLYGVFYGCQELIKSGFETLAEKEAASAAADIAGKEAILGTDPAADIPGMADGSFARCGEDSDKPAWFPADLDDAYVYHDADAPRVADMADIFSDEAEAAMRERIAVISAETGKDIAVVTDVSNYGLGEDIYAADFYDYNGYGIGDEHEGILLFLNMDPEDRGGWTVETGSETRALMTQRTANRLDDFLYDTLASGDYERAVAEWIEDVYSVFTVGIARPPFWFPAGGEAPEGYSDPGAPAVVDEWGLLTAEQAALLQERAEYLRQAYGVNVYFHTTGDRLGMSQSAYNELYMSSMGYEKDALLLSIENTDGKTEKYFELQAFGDMNGRIPEKFFSRIENKASFAGSAYERLFEGQRLLSLYMEHGRVPRSGFYWTMILILSALSGLGVSVPSLSKAKESMRTVRKQTSAYSYLDLAATCVKRISEKLLYVSYSRVYIPPAGTGSSSSSSGGSTYRSGYSGHSGVSHTGHGRKF